MDHADPWSLRSYEMKRSQTLAAYWRVVLASYTTVLELLPFSVRSCQLSQLERLTFWSVVADSVKYIFYASNQLSSSSSSPWTHSHLCMHESSYLGNKINLWTVCIVFDSRIVLHFMKNTRHTGWYRILFLSALADNFNFVIDVSDACFKHSLWRCACIFYHFRRQNLCQCHCLQTSEKQVFSTEPAQIWDFRCSCCHRRCLVGWLVCIYFVNSPAGWNFGVQCSFDDLLVMNVTFHPLFPSFFSLF